MCEDLGLLAEAVEAVDAGPLMKRGLGDSSGFAVFREYLKDVCPESAKVVERSGRKAVIFLPRSDPPGSPH